MKLRPEEWAILLALGALGWWAFSKPAPAAQTPVDLARFANPG